jgi:AP-2 complex subunit mu-1
VNVLLSNRGTVLKSDVVGQVIMKTQLSGMPECKFGINDKLLVRDNEKADNPGGAAA